MRKRFVDRIVLISAVAVTLYAVNGIQTTAQTPLSVDSARITISGTSNVHDYTASTAVVRVTRARVGAPSTEGSVWADAMKPGGVEAFEIAVPAATLSSPKEDIDKNMHKALQVEKYPDITFRLVRLEPASAAGAFRGVGVLKIAGVEREVALALTTTRKVSSLVVQGRLQLLMTDYGIKPPVAMLGMLKTNPKVTLTFETVLSVPSA